MYERETIYQVQSDINFEVIVSTKKISNMARFVVVATLALPIFHRTIFGRYFFCLLLE